MRLPSHYALLLAANFALLGCTESHDPSQSGDGPQLAMDGGSEGAGSEGSASGDPRSTVNEGETGRSEPMGGGPGQSASDMADASGRSDADAQLLELRDACINTCEHFDSCVGRVDLECLEGCIGVSSRALAAPGCFDQIMTATACLSALSCPELLSHDPDDGPCGYEIRQVEGLCDSDEDSRSGAESSHVDP